MRPRSWLLLLSLLLSLPASAGEPSLRRRTLMAPAHPSEVPPLELLVAAGTVTLLQLDASLKPGIPRLPPGETRILLVPVGGGAWSLVLTSKLAEDERVPLTVDAGPGAEPLRFSLATGRGEVDVQVRVVRAEPSADEDTAEALVRDLLATPEARATLAIPHEVVERQPERSRAQVDSVRWIGRRLFATVSVRDHKDGVPLWRLVQVRLRATLADGSLLEWPTRFLSGRPKARRQHHVLTGLLPEGSLRLELALDGEEAPGGFQPLPMQAPRVSP